MTLISMIGAGIPSTVIPFGGAALVAGGIVVGLLFVTVAVLVAADLRCPA